MPQGGEGGAMAQAKKAKGDGRAGAKKLLDLVQREVDDGATSVEEIHKGIANLPLDILERLDLFEECVKGARRVQEARIGAIYDLIRKVNDEAAKLAKELLAARPARKPAPRRTAHAHAR
jgi:hypothetical protein